MEIKENKEGDGALRVVRDSRDRTCCYPTSDIKYKNVRALILHTARKVLSLENSGNHCHIMVQNTCQFVIQG